jgi:hypothetical protein
VTLYFKVGYVPFVNVIIFLIFSPCITHQEELISACYMLLIILCYVCYVYFVIIILFVISFNVLSCNVVLRFVYCYI